VSRFTVIRSYEELASQGYIQTISGSGTFVNKEIPREFSSFVHTEEEAAELATKPLTLSDYGQRIFSSPDIESANAELFPELNYGAPSLDQLPLNRWREVLNKSARFQDNMLFEYTSDPFGYPELREAIAGYLIRARSVKCTPDQVAVFSGAQSATDLIGRMLLNPGDAVAVENPGFPGARRSLMTHDVKVVPIPVDGHGLQVEVLHQHPEKIKLVYVTPSHQDPTGTVMSLPRRLELLKWAERTGGLIIEDDFDSEYRYGEKPVPALQGLDEGDNVIYLSSFWKVLFPVVRMGFLVLPRRLTAPMHRAKSLIERDFPLLEQRALTDFINEGHLERHIRRTRAMYAKRRAALVQVLTRLFRKRITISDVSAGMHMLVTFSSDMDDAQIARAARNAHVPMVSSSNHYMIDPKPHEYLIGFAHGDEQQITSAIERFAQELTHEEQRTGQVSSASF
jgi:GntR family transcriptional regulator / MocR family aminotransferase